VEENQDLTVTIDETNTEHELNEFDLKRKCYDYARQAFQGKKFINKETGREIIVSKDGLGEWKSKSKSREQMLSVKILGRLLETASYMHDAQDKKGRKNIENLSYFAKNCKINGTEYKAVITIKKIKNYGDKYYHHYLENIKK
jgi:hypothetical protein